MEYLLKNAKILKDGRLVSRDISVAQGRIVSISENLDACGSAAVVDLGGAVVFPGFVDVHVHLREPGFSYKETIASGTLACARGGFTHVCAMPNLNPVPDSMEHLQVQLDIIEKDACIHVHPIGAITVGEQGEVMADLEAMAPHVAGFSDDGKGVQSREMMREAMVRAKALDKVITAHCEDNSLLFGGYIHDGEYARLHGHRGICSESEWGPIARDIQLAAEIGVKYHVCHISAKESVQLIREAKAKGIDATCEVGPHYLVFNDMDLQEDARFKMNPPIRAEEDRKALVAGIVDGTIDMIITDHAPHSAEEKGRGLEKSAMGVVGIETSFPVCYTHLVKPGIILLDKLVELMHDAPARRFGIGTDLAEGEMANLTAFDLDEKFIVDPADFRSMGKASPFTGMELYGVCKLTMADGEIVWQEETR